MPAPTSPAADFARLAADLGALHRRTAVGAAVRLDLPAGLDSQLVADAATGAGFVHASIERPRVTGRTGGRGTLTAVRARTLADTVAPAMRVLMVGLNPSVYAADAGVGFARPGNRFWPAMRASGLGCHRRDPVHLLTAHRVGMTDLVKRATRRADELTVDEYRAGLERVTRLVARIPPAVVCFVGLSGWRAAVDRRAVAGLQPRDLGGVPVYLMPSTSGLNAHAALGDLTGHLRSVARIAGGEAGNRYHSDMARRDAYLDHLAEVPMFSACSKKELQLLAKRAEDVTVSAGDVLIKEGATGREFFVIVDGKAEVSRNGKKLAVLGPGDHFGELALLEQAPRNATVTAASDMEVVLLDRREFTGVLNEVPSIAVKLLKGMARRLREADAKLVS